MLRMLVIVAEPYGRTSRLEIGIVDITMPFRSLILICFWPGFC